MDIITKIMRIIWNTMNYCEITVKTSKLYGWVKFLAHIYISATPENEARSSNQYENFNEVFSQNRRKICY